MNVVAVTQARMSSSRLPGKVLREVGGKTLLEIHLERLSGARNINRIIVATTLEPDSAGICRIARQMGISFFQGSLYDVLDRFYRAIMVTDPPDYLVRITADCPLLDPAIVDETIAFALSGRFDYASNCMVRTYPDGMDVEVFTFAALESAWKNAVLASEREHVTPFIRKNCDLNGGHLFAGGNWSADRDYSAYRLTVDEPSDLELVRHLVEALGTQVTWRDYLDYLTTHLDVLALNRHIVRNAGYAKSLEDDLK